MPDLEQEAQIPLRVAKSKFNQQCVLPYGLETSHIVQAMEKFVDFLGFVNHQLHTKRLPRLETF